MARECPESGQEAFQTAKEASRVRTRRVRRGAGPVAFSLRRMASGPSSPAAFAPLWLEVILDYNSCEYFQRRAPSRRWL